MVFIDKNDDLIERSGPEKYYMLDAVITRFDIYERDYTLTIDVYFTIPKRRPEAERKLLLRFIGVTEYGFHWNNKHDFYNVEHCKFLSVDEGYYLSTDPVDESDEPADEDQDFILASEVEGYFL